MPKYVIAAERWDEFLKTLARQVKPEKVVAVMRHVGGRLEVLTEAEYDITEERESVTWS